MNEVMGSRSGSILWRRYIVGLVFVAGLLVGALIYFLYPSGMLLQALSTELRLGSRNSLINPLLECEISTGLLNREIISFESKIKHSLDIAKESKYITDGAVYFRSLNNGIGFGINEREGFFPASLLKTPLMMAYYKLVESDPNLLTRKLTFLDSDYPASNRPRQEFPPRESLRPGKAYTVDDLIRRMIVYSDNSAAVLLSKNIDLEFLRDTYYRLNVPSDVLDDFDGTISIRDYSRFFRVLYNASYLTSEFSERALKLMTAAEFKEGIAAGLPPGIVVAHKFGETSDPKTGQELHECGIVYYTENPYLLCVMTRGQDTAKLALTIADISRLSYGEVDKQISVFKKSAGTPAIN